MPPVPPGLAAPTKAFLTYLREHPELRARIRAAPNQTVAYAGAFANVAAWQRLKRLQLSAPVPNDFQTINDIMKAIPCPADLYAKIGLVTPPAVRTLLGYVEFLTGEAGHQRQVPEQDAFIIWRALSGILMSNAVGRVRLLIGDVPDPSKKVFFRTEMFVLQRNPDVDPFSVAAIGQLRERIKRGELPGKIEML